MKTIARKVKNLKGRICGYKADLGPISGSADTPAEAVALVEGNALEALARLDRGGRIFTWRGHTVIVSPTLAGWDYWIDTFSAPDYRCGVSSRVREDAEDAALHHLAQNVWTLEIADDAAFTVGLPKEVRGKIHEWIVFQRAYAAAKAEGKPEHEWHRIGSEAASRSSSDALKVAS